MSNGRPEAGKTTRREMHWQPAAQRGLESGEDAS